MKHMHANERLLKTLIERRYQVNNGRRHGRESAIQIIQIILKATHKKRSEALAKPEPIHSRTLSTLTVMSLPTTNFVLDDTMGAIMIGVVFASALWGVSSAQAFYYFTNFREDPHYLKTLVALVWMLDTIHQALISHSIYHYVITNFSNIQKLDSITPSLIVEVEVNAIVAFVVQLFFIWRIWKLSEEKYYIPVMIIAIATAGLVVSSAYVHKAFKLDGFHELVKLQTLSALVNVFSAVTDVLIAAVMVYLLHSARSGIQHTDTVINRLLVFVINTGLLTSICAVCSLIAVLLAPDRFIHICFFFTLGRLYTNSFLATLNTRHSMFSPTRTDLSSISLRDISVRPCPHSIHNRGMTVGAGVRHGEITTVVPINIGSTMSRDVDLESFKHEGLSPSPSQYFHTKERY